MMTLEEMADIMAQRDKSEREAAVDALSEADAKEMLKRMLSTMHRLPWPDSNK